MKNQILSTMLAVLIISTSAFAQSDTRNVKSRNGKSTRVSTPASNKSAVRNTNKNHSRTKGYYNQNTRKTSTRRTTTTRKATTRKVTTRKANVRKANNRQVRANQRRVSKLRNSRRLNHRGVGYYYNNGSFYQRRNGYYNIVAAPVGYHINILPVGCRTFRRGGVAYYFTAGNYYTYNNRGYYQVVAPPTGHIVYDLPFGTDTLTINGLVYYEYAGTLYQRIETQNGFAYQVSGAYNS